MVVFTRAQSEVVYAALPSVSFSHSRAITPKTSAAAGTLGPHAVHRASKTHTRSLVNLFLRERERREEENISRESHNQRKKCCLSVYVAGGRNWFLISRLSQP